MAVNHLAIERCCNFGTCKDIRYLINCHYQTEDGGDKKERNQIMSQAGFKLSSPVLTLTAWLFFQQRWFVLLMLLLLSQNILTVPFVLKKNPVYSGMTCASRHKAMSLQTAADSTSCSSRY